MTDAPPPPAPEGSDLKPHRGVMILIFGILGFVCCPIFGIVAWVMGSGDLKEMAAGQMDPTGEGLTRGGQICGIISVILGVLGFLVYLAFFAIMFAANPPANF